MQLGASRAELIVLLRRVSSKNHSFQRKSLGWEEVPGQKIIVPRIAFGRSRSRHKCRKLIFAEQPGAADRAQLVESVIIPRKPTPGHSAVADETVQLANSLYEHNESMCRNDCVDLATDNLQGRAAIADIFSSINRRVAIEHLAPSARRKPPGIGADEIAVIKS